MKKKKLSAMQKFSITVIAIAILLVSFSIIAAILFSPERTTKQLFSSIAADYYENYFYAKVVDANNLSKYEVSGLSPISLRQLLLYDNQKNADASAKLEKYCNTEQTYVKFYPKPPFSQKSYHAEYTYSCNFD